MKKTTFPLIFLCLLLAQVHAQIQLTSEVLASAGNTYQSGELTLDWTLGEVMIESYTSSSLQLGQGFHHGYTDGVTAVFEAPGLRIDIQAYPNPVSHQLFLQTNSPSPLIFQLIDLMGRVVLTQYATSDTSHFDMDDLPDALYQLKVMREDGFLLKTFKILKTNF